jgi:UDP-arabinose 4-epimerase
MINVLVTGGAGYIGSHTCKWLAKRGFNPVVYDDLSLGHRWAVKYGPLVEANVADRGALEVALREFDIQAVIHFAAFTLVGESVADPRKFFVNNCGGMQILLDTLLDNGKPPIIFSSSCATYGNPQRMPLDEDHPQDPVSPYGETKLFGERVLKAYDQAYGLRHVALRYFNAAGADPDGEIGEAHNPESHLIPNVIKAVLGTKPPLSVFGDDYPTPDGTAVRDYIHVNDLADAHVRALQYLLDGGDSTQLNVGTGIGTSVKQIIDAVERVAGKPVPHSIAPRRAGDPPDLYAAPAKIKATLGWEPEWTDIDRIVQTAYDWETTGFPAVS